MSVRLRLFSDTARSFASREALVEDIATKDPLVSNTLGEDIRTLKNRVYFPLRLSENLEPGQPDGLMGVLRMVNLHRDENCRPVDCIDFDTLSYLTELIAVLGNRYLRNVSILHDQERATHGFSTDLLTIKLVTELNLKHAGTVKQFLETLSARQNRSAMGSVLLKDLGMTIAELDSAIYSANQLFARCTDILSIQDHMAEQMLRVLQTNDNKYVGEPDDSDVVCTAPYKTVFLRLLGAKAGMAKMFNRKDLKITSNGQPRFDDDFQKLPPLAISSSALYLVVRNLAENAIKYCPEENTPELDITWEKKSDTIEFKFQDYGIGITNREKERLFTEGFRGLEAQRMQLRGNGIGLSLSVEAANRFGGHLSLARSDEKSLGSLFLLTLKIHGS